MLIVLGKIIPIFEERLRSLGGWLRTNGQAIYGSTYWSSQNDTRPGNQVWYTQSKDKETLFAITLLWPRNGIVLRLNDVVATNKTQIYLLGYTKNPLDYAQYDDYLLVKFPPLHSFIRECEDYCQWAYTLKITHFHKKG